MSREKSSMPAGLYHSWQKKQEGALSENTLKPSESVCLFSGIKVSICKGKVSGNSSLGKHTTWSFPRCHVYIDFWDGLSEIALVKISFQHALMFPTKAV